MAQCPVFDPNNIIAPPSAVPEIRMLWTANAPGLSIPWDVFNKDSKEAPGGNRYYTMIIDAKPPLVSKIPAAMKPGTTQSALKGSLDSGSGPGPGLGLGLGLANDGTVDTYLAQHTLVTQTMARAQEISRRHWNSYFGPGKEHGAMKMKDVLSHYQDQLGFLFTQLGWVKTPVVPEPNETAADFTTRGGYLLWCGGWPGSVGGSACALAPTGDGGGVFGRYVNSGITGGTYPLQSMGPWAIFEDSFTKLPTNTGVPDDVKQGIIDNVCDLECFIAWDWKRNRLKYIIRLSYKSTWAKAWNKIGKAIEWFKGKVCGLLTNESLAYGASMASGAALNPAAQAAYGAYQLVAAACGKKLPACDVGPTTAYPPGTIAHFNKKLNVYDIAQPLLASSTALQGLGGLQGANGLNGAFSADYLTTGAVTSLPLNVREVNWFAWENATKNWYSRTWIQVGGAGLAAATVLFLVVKQKRKAA